MSEDRLVVFVVDDEVVIAQTLAIILNQSGFHAIAFHRAEAAIAALTTFVPDLLISDVVMPGMTGVDLAMHFRSVQPSCKILLFSGQAATLDLLEDSRSKGHTFEVLLKPLHPVDLLARLRG